MNLHAQSTSPKAGDDRGPGPGVSKRRDPNPAAAGSFPKVSGPLGSPSIRIIVYRSPFLALGSIVYIYTHIYLGVSKNQGP